jgi:hypothetical protein
LETHDIESNFIKELRLLLSKALTVLIFYGEVVLLFLGGAAISFGNKSLSVVASLRGCNRVKTVNLLRNNYPNAEFSIACFFEPIQ